MATPLTLSQCPSDEPLPPEVAENDPAWQSVCYLVVDPDLGPPGFCPQADPPVVDLTFTDPIQAQEVVLSATVPANFAATSAYWSAEVVHSDGTRELLWEHVSTEGSPFAGGQAVRFGAPGLVSESVHYFRVAFCDEVNCFCWSDRSAAVTSNPFSDSPVPLPGGPVEQIVEDTFHRPQTSPYLAPGDGLGPEEVWLGYDGPRILDLSLDKNGGETFAVLPEAKTAKWTKPADHSHNLAQIEFLPLCTAENPNPPSNTSCAEDATDYHVEVEVRYVSRSEECPDPSYRDPNKFEAFYYMAQLLYEPNWGELLVPDPTLRIIRAEPVPSAWENSDGSGEVTECTSMGTHLASDTITNLCPNITEDDVAGLRNATRPILLRLEANTNKQTKEVQLTTIISWENCTSEGECVRVECTVCRIDDSLEPTHVLYDTPGHWGATAHHWDHRLESFVTGSEPTSGQ